MRYAAFDCAAEQLSGPADVNDNDPDPDDVQLTGVLADIARVADRDAAIAIGRKFGGTRVYFPVHPRADHWLVAMVGRTAAEAICDELTAGRCGLSYDLPVGAFGHQETARAKVDRLLAEGRSQRDIALATRYTDRGVRKRKKLLRDRAPDLFDT